MNELKQMLFDIGFNTTEVSDFITTIQTYKQNNIDIESAFAYKQDKKYLNGYIQYIDYINSVL